MWKYLALVGNIGLIIAIPIVCLAYLGHYLDNRFATSPWFLLVGIILSFIISSAILYRQVLGSMKLMEEEMKKTSKKNDKTL